jgi:hypothetical protein
MCLQGRCLQLLARRLQQLLLSLLLLQVAVQGCCSSTNSAMTAAPAAAAAAAAFLAVSLTVRLSSDTLANRRQDLQQHPHWQQAQGSATRRFRRQHSIGWTQHGFGE